MAVRTAYAPVAGAVLTAADLAKLSGGWIGYNEVTANQTGMTTGPTDLTSLTVTVTVGTGRRIKVSGHGLITASLSSGSPVVSIFEGATELNRSQFTHQGAAQWSTHDPAVVLAPSAGSHTYKLVFSSNSGTWSLTASATFPAFIAVEDIGSTP